MGCYPNKEDICIGQSLAKEKLILSHKISLGIYDTLMDRLGAQ